MDKDTFDKIEELRAQKENIEREIEALKAKGTKEIGKKLFEMRQEIQKYKNQAVRLKGFSADNVFIIYRVDSQLLPDGFYYRLDLVRPVGKADALYVNDRDNGEDDFNKVSEVGGVALEERSLYMSSLDEFEGIADVVDINMFFASVLDNLANVLKAIG